MADKVYWSVNVDVQNGPKFARTQALDVEAYEKIQVSVPGEDPANAGKPGKASIAVLPTGSTAQFLLITSDRFDPEKLTYKVPGNSTDFVLDGPHMPAGGPRHPRSADEARRDQQYGRRQGCDDHDRRRPRCDAIVQRRCPGKAAQV